MAAEDGALQREVGIDVEHAAVVVPHQSQAVVLHDVRDASGVDPGVDFIPGIGRRRACR